MVGLSPYLILAVLSGIFGDELYSWGDTSSVTGLVKHVLRQEYGTFDLISGFERTTQGILQGLALYLSTTSQQSLHLAFPSTLLILIHTLILGKGEGRGARGGDGGRREVLGVIMCAWVGYVLFFHWRSNLPLDHPLYRGVLKRFYMQPNMLVTIFVGYALSTVLRDERDEEEEEVAREEEEEVWVVEEMRGGGD